MADYSQGFKGYEQAEDIHGQIRLCKGANNNMLHLKNMNFNFACCYDDNQARQVKMLLDKEGVKALSLFVLDGVDAGRAKALASIYGVEYLVTDNSAKADELKNEITEYEIITEGEQ